MAESIAPVTGFDWLSPSGGPLHALETVAYLGFIVCIAITFYCRHCYYWSISIC